MNKETIDLNLLVIYLTGWEEDSRIDPGAKIFRSWRGYDFEVLNEFERQGLIRQCPRSLVVTKEGISKAEGLKHKYLDSQKRV
jgi:hypothetical protein